ncbi:bactofilin family protein [Chengkuizengella axinellae]|uniref:Polymer-forming cytoskeletal protein n=1 Tax=Chengkuizengella axinellae TaxID=3064388 RepID=A0ABT9J4Y6_9BACL|nr:polymer-forming cytoskeletal protein [Chengkuizengella sp. 2205SS18-9]MDP5276668.1 polymer-forming cytoskeletal protein [Chengkuizengella sp. 2205SS18-9]
MDPNKTDTLVGEGTIFEGNIKSEASIRIDGKIIGDIHCEGDVTIGEKGAAISNITARNITVAGKIEGNVTANEKMEIASTGKVNGNISMSVLTIEDGGVFEGSSKMNMNQAREGKQNVSDQEKRKNVPA